MVGIASGGSFQLPRSERSRNLQDHPGSSVPQVRAGQCRQEPPPGPADWSGCPLSGRYGPQKPPTRYWESMV